LPSWKIRTAVEPDLAHVLALWKTAGSSATAGETPGGLAGLLAHDPNALLVADLDGIVIGSLIVGWDGWRGSFYRLAVHPKHRRRGVAISLLRSGEQRLRDLNASRLTAIVLDEDSVAMSFWGALGYERQRHRARFVRHADAKSSHFPLDLR
jgi:ribosomal protein S18 acetylase RimI-like enzyme